MKKIFLLSFLFLIISINTQKNKNAQQAPKKPANKVNQPVSKNNTILKNQNNTKLEENSTSVLGDEKNSTEKNEFNLTAALITFFQEMFGSSNTTNETKTEEEKKLEEKKKEEQKKEEENKRKILEQIQIEKQKAENKAREKRLQLEKEREEFEKKIENISVSEFTNLYLEPKSGELLYHNTTRPCQIKIIFLLTDSEKTIHLTFNGPNARGNSGLIQSFRQKNFLYYIYDAKFVGQYTFYLNNFHNSDETEVIFAVSDDSRKSEDKLEKKKIDKISGYLKEIDNKINTMSTKQNIINRKTETHNKSVNKHNKKILIYAIIEVITMIIVFLLQTCYIKKIVEKI